MSKLVLHVIFLYPLQQLLLLLLLLNKHCSGEIFSINDRNYPHIFINDQSTVVPVTWHKKAIGFRLANAAAVRINARYKPSFDNDDAACTV